MTTRSHRDARALIAWAIVMTAAAVVIMYALWQVRRALLLILISGVLAIGFSPVVRMIQRQKMLPLGPKARFPRWAAILILYLLILGTVATIGMMIVPPLVDQATELYEDAPALIDRAQTYLLDKGLLPARLTLQDAIAAAPGAGSEAVTPLINAVTNIVGGVFGILTILILTFYLLVEAHAIRDSFLCLLPRDRREQVAVMLREITVKVSAWLMGQLLLASVIGATAALGLWLLGVPYFYVLALIAAVGELIPVIGPVLAAIPAIAVAFSVGPQKALAVGIFFLVQQQFENHVLVPKIMERQVGVSAVTVIMALLIGGSLLGIIGAILAVPMAAIIQVLFEELTGADREDAPAKP